MEIFHLFGGMVFFVFGIVLFGSFWKNQKIVLLGVFFLFLGGFLPVAQTKTDLLWTQAFVGERFSGEMRVLSEGAKESYTQRILVETSVCEENECFPQKAFLRTSPFQEYTVGEIVRGECEWEVPEYDEKTQTNWMAIFASQGTPLFCKDENPERTGVVVKDWRYTFSQIRESFESHIVQVIPYPESALGAGLLFGGTSRFSDDWEEKFAQTSMTHIVAVSGYNVTLLVQYLGLLAVLLGFHRKHSWVVGVVGIVFFIALIGFPSSGVRAGDYGNFDTYRTQWRGDAFGGPSAHYRKCRYGFVESFPSSIRCWISIVVFGDTGDSSWGSFYGKTSSSQTHAPSSCFMLKLLL